MLPHKREITRIPPKCSHNYCRISKIRKWAFPKKQLWTLFHAYAVTHRLKKATGTHPIIRNRSMQNVSKIHGILGGTGPGTGCYIAYSPLFEAIRRYSRTRMSRRFLIQGISYNRMRTRMRNNIEYGIHLLIGGGTIS